MNFVLLCRQIQARQLADCQNSDLVVEPSDLFDASGASQAKGCAADSIDADR